MDTVPRLLRAPAKPEKCEKVQWKVEEGRTARELDLRIDEEEPEAAIDSEICVNLDVLKGENVRIEADEWTNLDAWKESETLNDKDALEELNEIGLNEEALETLKELNIDEDLWNELNDLKVEMDALRNELEKQRARGVDDYRMHESVKRVLEAVRMEMPRVRKEVERTLRAFINSEGWKSI